MLRIWVACSINVTLTNIDFSNFNTQNVVNMSSMFDGCKSLRSLDLSNFNTQNVVNMIRMFEGCESLRSLDLSNFHIWVKCSLIVNH